MNPEVSGRIDRFFGKHVTGLLFAIALTMPASGEDEDLEQLQPGQWIEAKGILRAGQPVVTELEEVPRASHDKAEKVELTAPAESAGSDAVHLLGCDLIVDASTTFEDDARQAVAPFTPAPGDWLRVKARLRDDGTLRAREVRPYASRDRFKIVGEVFGFDSRNRTVEVGGVTLPVSANANLSLLERRDDPLSRFLADDQKGVPLSIRVGDSLRFGGQFSAKLEWNDEFELDADRARDRSKTGFGGKLDALWLIEDRGSYAFGEVAFGRSDTFRQAGEHTHDQAPELTRAFVSWRAHENVQIMAGRQDIEDEREWLYDEVLDGVRAIFSRGRLELEATAVGGRKAAAPDNELEDTRLFSTTARWYLNSRWHVSAYALRRDGGAADFDLTLYGVRSYARPRRGFGHWLELGGARGETSGKTISGFAFDVGGSYSFDAPWRPTVGAGIAQASGEGDSSDRIGYRQSGLQDNNAKLGGVTSVRFYGELFDPELANLRVTTLFAAVRPFPGASLSLLLHSYRQDVAAAIMPDTGLRIDPNGASADLGTEIDLVLGYRLRRHLTAELVAARFTPGAAFDGNTSATLLELAVRTSF